MFKKAIRTHTNYIIFYSKGSYMNTINKLIDKYDYKPKISIEVTSKDKSKMLNYALIYLPKGGYILDYSSIEDMNDYIQQMELLVMKYKDYKHVVMNYTSVLDLEFKSKHQYSYYVNPFHIDEELLQYTNRIPSLLSVAAIDTIYKSLQAFAFTNNEVYNHLINNNIDTEIGVIKINSINHVEFGLSISQGDRIVVDVKEPIPNARFYYMFDIHCLNVDNIKYTTIGLIHNIYGDNVDKEFLYLDFECSIISRINYDYRSSFIIQPKIYLIRSVSDLPLTSELGYFIGGKYLFF